MNMNNVLVLNLPSSAIRYISLKKILNLRLFGFLISISAIFLLAFYVFQTSELVSDGYQVGIYQKKISELSQGNKLLEINSVKVNSLENIENRIQELGLEKIDKVYYIQVLENPIVTRK